MNRPPKDVPAPGRFYKIPQDLAARKDLTATAKIVFAVIRDRIGANGKAWPGTQRIAADAGLTQPTVLRAVWELNAAGCLDVEDRGKGRTFHYRLLEGTAQEPCAVAKGERRRNRARTFSPGAQEPCAEPHKNLAPNQTDPLNQTGAASPPASDASRKTPKPASEGNGAGKRLVALWARGCKARGIVFGNRGQVSGLLAGMVKVYGEGVLTQAVGRWWGADRADYGFPLFKARLDGGNRELTGRAGVRPDPGALKRSASAAAVIAEALGMET